MGYPEDALAADEELLLHRHPHWKMLVLPALTFILATALAGFVFGLAQARLGGTAATVALLAIAAMWAAAVSWRCLAPFVSWKVGMTIDGRVAAVDGTSRWITSPQSRADVHVLRARVDIPMGRISNVQFRHGLVDRMLRTGTLVIVSASDDPIEFDDIPNVQRVHSLLYHQVFDTMALHRDEPDSAHRRDADGAGGVRKGW